MWRLELYVNCGRQCAGNHSKKLSRETPTWHDVYSGRCHAEGSCTWRDAPHILHVSVHQCIPQVVRGQFDRLQYVTPF